MAVQTRVEPINRDIELLLSEELSPSARSQQLATFAGESIEEAKQQNGKILGRIPRSQTFVDGKEGAPLASVRPDGVIVTEFELLTDTLRWISEQLQLHSPVGGKGDRHPGLYRRSHTLFADGIETEIGAVLPDATEFVFINLVPYARKIERGSSSQAPDGVYQAVAALARRRFGNIARISFTYRAAVGGAFVGGRAGNKSEGRMPAISIVVAR